MISKKKNLLFIDNSRPGKNIGIGGSLKSLIQLIKRLNKEHYNIYILLYYRFPMLKNIFEDLGIEPIYRNSSTLSRGNKIKKKVRTILPFYSDLFVIKNFKQVHYISSIIKKYSIDIVHANNRINANILCLLAAKRCKVPYIQHQRAFEKKTSLSIKLNKSYPLYYFAISHSINKNIQQIVKVPKNKIKLIHNWINSNSLINKKKNEDKKIFKILWIGRIVSWKGLDVLILIAEMLKNNNFGIFEIDIFGDYNDLDYKKSLIKMIKKLNLESQIKFKGFKMFEEIRYSDYSVYIHTSKSPEPFGRTIIENMLVEIPVCATSMGGVLDIITHDDNGILYDYKNYKTLIPYLFKFKNNREYREKIIFNAKKTILEKFSGDFQIKTIEKIYESI